MIGLKQTNHVHAEYLGVVKLKYFHCPLHSAADQTVSARKIYVTSSDVDILYFLMRMKRTETDLEKKTAYDTKYI